MVTGSGPDLPVGARYLLEQISEACYALDHDSRFILVNTQATRLLGRSSDELLGHNCWELFPEAVDAGLRDHYLQVMTSGEPASLTVYYPAHDRWYAIRALPIRDGVLVLFHDDTPKVRQERRNRVLVEQALDGITLMDADFVPFYRSPANARILGGTPEQTLEPVVLHPEDEQRVRAKVAQLRDQEHLTLTYRAQHAAGHWVWVQGTFTNRLADPAVAGIVLNFRDITEERHLQAEADRQRQALLQSNRAQQLHIDRLNTLHRIHLSSVAANDRAGSLRAILSSAIKGQPRIAFCYLDDTDEIHAVSHAGLAVAAAALPESAIRELARETLRTGSIIRFTPAELQHSGAEFLSRFRTAFSEGIAVPFDRPEARGVVMLLSPEPTHDDEHAESFLVTLAGYIGAAVATVRLVEKLERSAEDYRVLAEFSMRIETVNDLDTLVTAGLKDLLDHLQLDNGGLAEVIDGHAVPRWRHGDIAPEDVQVLMQPIPLERGAIGRAVHSGEAVLIRDYRQFRDRPPHLKDVDLTSLLAVPIEAGAAGRYVFILTSLDEKRLISDQDVVVATMFAKRIGNALERLSYIEEVKATRDATFRSLGVALEYRDYETKGHTDRVTNLIRRMAEKLDLGKTQLQALQWGAYLHDLGKLTVPDHILLKQGPLTPEEFEVIKRHPLTGEDMCRDIPFLPPETLEIIRHHHERFDGSGYPDGLAGEAIPFSARLFAPVDVYDALRSDRPYRKAVSRDVALDYMREQSGKHFDPDLLTLFVELIESPAAE